MVFEKLSHPESKGKGFCGAGLETYLVVSKKEVNLPLNKKMILNTDLLLAVPLSSCLQSVDLDFIENDKNQEQSRYESVLKINQSSLEVSWVSPEKKVILNLGSTPISLDKTLWPLKFDTE